jgi:hypothetical protein
MVHTAEYQRLMTEALSSGRIAQHFVIKDFDGNIALQSHIASAKHNSHAA